MDSHRLGDVQWVTVECGPVLRHIFAAVAGHTDAQFMQAHCVATGPESVSVQPAHSLQRASTITHDRRGDIDY